MTTPQKKEHSVTNFEICFICRFPTTDWAEVNGGEKHCGLCRQEEAELADLLGPTESEQELVFLAMEREWSFEDLEDFYNQINS